MNKVEINGCNIAIFDRDKGFFPAANVTMGDLIDYSADIPEVMLTHI